MPADDDETGDELDPEGPGPEDLAELDEDSETDVRPCPNCGAEIYHDADRCPRCGQYVVPGRGSGGGGKSLPLWWILLILAAAALLVLWLIVH